ncbi:uncharacterized protein MONBRDRAFT_34659 [Monosiga brevicollis MX1]|uniref:Coiled-coil domain-containing protein 153 n=1 Tax=Monosiga brevicollis TaxID=81824 RepID=A9VD68_MONBE|nr:uncharacterized protein MONBRDRAFT_34659 [Monosiga brevicollis MX1]EDQ84477.1 predicted protein [Monosiga brevicollis MX1]|eukprot:XP_001750664.1 hypothetical protein [Monosiga brevicollis MX1]
MAVPASWPCCPAWAGGRLLCWMRIGVGAGAFESSSMSVAPNKTVVAEANKQLQAMHTLMQEQEAGFATVLQEKDAEIDTLRYAMSDMKKQLRELLANEEQLKAEAEHARQQRDKLAAALRHISSEALAAATAHTEELGTGLSLGQSETVTSRNGEEE